MTRWSWALVAIAMAAPVALGASGDSQASEEDLTDGVASDDAASIKADPPASADEATTATRESAKMKRKRRKKLPAGQEDKTLEPASDAPHEPPPPPLTMKANKRKKSATPRPRTVTQRVRDGQVVFELGTDASLGAGFITGDGIHRSADGGPAVMTVMHGDIDPTLRWTMFELSLPSRLSHRETWGGSLSRTDAATSLSLTFKPVRQWRLSADVGVAGSSRPEWLDPYQPIDNLPDNGLLATDRRSRTALNAGAKMLLVPWSKTYVRLKYDFSRTASVVDPNFEAIERPNHLTPIDGDEHAVAGSVKWSMKTLSPKISAGLFRRDWFFVFSRDAGTGATHATSGGDPPNPLQSIVGVDVEPEANLSLFRDAVEVDMGWRLRLVDDLYEGYYSRMENRFSFGVDSTLGPAGWAVDTKARFAFSEVLYGDSAYALSKTHPPLDFGDRRELRRASASVVARFPAASPVQVFVDVGATSQLTNFPDYAPGVFPTTQAYTVDWDYATAQAMLGVAWTMDVTP